MKLDVQMIFNVFLKVLDFSDYFIRILANFEWVFCISNPDFLSSQQYIRALYSTLQLHGYLS